VVEAYQIYFGAKEKPECQERLFAPIAEIIIKIRRTMDCLTDTKVEVENLIASIEYDVGKAIHAMKILVELLEYEADESRNNEIINLFNVTIKLIHHAIPQLQEILQSPVYEFACAILKMVEELRTQEQTQQKIAILIAYIEVLPKNPRSALENVTVMVKVCRAIEYSEILNMGESMFTKHIPLLQKILCKISEAEKRETLMMIANN
jgi:hypothetical protein